MLNNIERIRAEGREIILLGIAHVSSESIELVKETIDAENPDVVGVELCEHRQETLINRKKWDDAEFTKVIREGRGYLFLINLLLANFQRKIGDALGVQPGSEMVEVLKIARERNINVALLDRDIQVTLKRAWGIMPFFEKIKLFFFLLYDFVYGVFEGHKINKDLIKQLKDKDIVSELMNELSREAPSAKKVLVDERDIYIANKILSAKGNKVVAVVGAGHVSGIKRYIENYITEKKPYDIKQLEEMPKKSISVISIVKYAIPLIFIIILLYGFKSGSLKTVMDMFAIWVIFNAVFGAAGAALARAHPYTIIASAIASPITSINPITPPGLIAAIVEAHIRKPKVKDFKEVTQLKTIWDLWKNNLTRIMLVFLFTSLGSSIGSIGALAALYYMASHVI